MSVYQSAARILKDALEKKGAVKTLVYSSDEKDKRKLFALVCETLKYKTSLFKILKETDILNTYGWNEETCKEVFTVSDDIDYKYLALPLLYDYLYGKGLGKAGRIRSLITKHKGLVLKTFSKLKSEKEISDVIDHKVNKSSLPRYVRVNTLKATQDDIINRFQQEGWFLKTDYEPSLYCEVLKSLAESEFLVDPVIPGLLAFPPGTDFHSHYLNDSGAIILQDRASCFPASILNPPPGSHVVDCCAAPGNKTTQLAAIMNNEGKILAFDLSKERLATLQEFINKGEVTNTTVRCADFMTIDPTIKGCESVEYILVDPSCSGSGIAERRNELTDDVRSTAKKRLRKLSRFQSLLLQHALSFPSAKRVVYSTCSVHEEENEQVVEEVSQKFQDRFQLEYILPEWTMRGRDGYNCSKFCLRLDTNQHFTNGFFVACFVLKSKNSNSQLVNDINGGQSDEDMPTNSNHKKKKKRKLSPSPSRTDNEISDVSEVKKEKKSKKKHKKKHLSDDEESIENNEEIKEHTKKKHKKKHLSDDEETHEEIKEHTKKKKKKSKHSSENLEEDSNKHSDNNVEIDSSISKNKRRKKKKSHAINE
ncbi:28S rRNA (cytosine-C(5))-methyltransferase [Patella vulgata]|uniref:28S rRNA (cytosine-C(5))-methyltransferase n=1 Tax=Patella vulgata TaxID=6465 RepID=UPI00218025C2|nr:28S rRNA (cytosine-C(5))-methyltransferase [Patella vulgata]